MNSYKFDPIANTLTVSKAFADACQNTNSEEYKTLCTIQKDFPKVQIVKRTHRTPSHYVTSDGCITKKNPNKNLTYERMERFLWLLPNSEEYMRVYTSLREASEAINLSAYSDVCKWFKAQFPHYRTNPLFYINNEVKLLNFADFVTQRQAVGDESL